MAMEMHCTLCFEDFASHQPGGALLNTEAKCYICRKYAGLHARRNPLLATQGQEQGQQAAAIAAPSGKDYQGDGEKHFRFGLFVYYCCIYSNRPSLTINLPLGVLIK